MIGRLIREWFDLSRRGILGMNARNRLIARLNPRLLTLVVNDKLRFQGLADRLQLPTPTCVAVVRHEGEIAPFLDRDDLPPSLILKPGRGLGGKGILLLNRDDHRRFRTADGATIDRRQIAREMRRTLAGTYSIEHSPDAILVQRCVRGDPRLNRLSYRGLPDVRVLCYRNVPLLAMLRAATRRSRGRGNLHQGGIGIAIDIAWGETTHAVQNGRPIAAHPDTGEALVGCVIPEWGRMLEVAVRTSRAVGLGLCGIDLVLDESAEVLVLEANARPGLTIQQVCRQGLLPLIRAVDRDLD